MNKREEPLLPVIARRAARAPAIPDKPPVIERAVWINHVNNCVVRGIFCLSPERYCVKLKHGATGAGLRIKLYSCMPTIA